MGAPYHIETSPLICSVNQWTGFYMIRIFFMEELNDLHGLKKKLKFFKNSKKPTCTGLIVTKLLFYLHIDQTKNFKHTSMFETGPSDFHLLTLNEFR